MAVCGLRTLLLIVCILELIVTVQRQVFDFLGYMWLPIIANFVNILLIIFGSFGAVQYITKYLLAYAIWSFMWLSWNIFLICYYLNLGTLNRDSGLLSLGTGSLSWWEGNGWGCQPIWAEEQDNTPGIWRPTKVDGCYVQWHYIELAQSALAASFTILALPFTILLAFRSFNRGKQNADKGTLPRRPVYTIELSPTETTVSETTLKPMTPRRVKRRSGSRGTGSSVRRSRRSYRNAGYLASTASLPRESRPTRPMSAHSSYSNFHAARPASYHAPERDAYEPPPPPPDSVPIVTNRYDSIRRVGVSGYDVVGPYNEPERYDQEPYDKERYEPERYEKEQYEPERYVKEQYEPEHYEKEQYEPQKYDKACYDPARNYEHSVPTYSNLNRTYEAREAAYVGGFAGGAYGDGWQAPPPPAPPYSARATPQAPGPPAYQPAHPHDNYNVLP